MATARDHFMTTLDRGQLKCVCADLGAFLETGIHASAR
jgi:hypothetical protein